MNITVAKYQNINPSVKLSYPFIIVNNFRVNVETFEYEGSEDGQTDNFRDFFRRWGIRIYTKRPFATHFEL